MTASGAAMTCSSCGHENPATAKFCEECDEDTPECKLSLASPLAESRAFAVPCERGWMGGWPEVGNLAWGC
jgi:hypothetical protein